MRKKVCLFLTIGIILATSMTAYAFNWKFWQKKEANAAEISVATVADFEILPTMDSVSNAKNQVWVGTFQLIWNDLINELVKHPIEFFGYKSVMAYNLNKQAFTTADISDSAYYKKWGLASPQLKQEIEDGIKLNVRIRYQGKDNPATLYNDGDKIRVVFDEEIKSPTPGQSAVFYLDDIVVGGGIIE